MKRLLLLPLVWGVFAGAAAAQEGKAPSGKKEMNVDMPDETEETDLVDKGQIQLETALLYDRYRQGSSSLVGQALLRYGLSENVEVRALAEDGRGRDRYIEETVQSTFPLALGTKVSLVKDVPLLPDITFVGYIKLPFTSHSKAQQAYWSPSLLLAFQHKLLDDKFKIEYNAGVQEDAFSRDWSWLANASLHYKLTQSLELFTEYYAQYEGGEEPVHNLGGGLALQIGELFETYLSGGSTVAAGGQGNYFCSAGLAVRSR